MPHAFLCKKKFRTKRLFAAKNEKAAWDQDPRQLSFLISVEFWVLPLTAHRSLLPFDFCLPSS
jgi:hypothetical protein